MECEKYSDNGDLSENGYIEKNVISSKCGEIIITENHPIVEFNLVCLHCGSLSQSFDDFRDHFLNEHYHLEEDSQTLTHIKSSGYVTLESHENSSGSKLFSSPKKPSTDSTKNAVLTQHEPASTFSSKFKEFYENEKKKEASSETETFVHLEPEIQIERYENFDSESFISENDYEYSNSDNETEISEAITSIFYDSDHTGSLEPNDNSCKSSKLKLKPNLNSNLSFKKNKNEEKTIEIYKEAYTPQKPKFVLAAVNLPIKSNISNDDDDSCSKTEADPEAFPQDEAMDSGFEIMNQEFKPKFKFNNIKFRRQHNERYYLSIEKTFNEKDGLFYCPECSKRYKRIESLRYHHLSHTGVPAPYQCSICHKGFPSAYKVRIHFTKHTGERPFRCHLCPRVYRHKQQLKFHLETHTELNLNNHDINTKTEEIS